MSNLEETLAQAIHKAVNAAESGADFLAAELPDYIQQLLMWHMAKHAVLSGLLAALSVCAFILFRWCNKQRVNDGPYSDWAFGQGLSASACLGLFVGCVVNLLTPIQILIAPKVFLVEYAARLVS